MKASERQVAYVLRLFERLGIRRITEYLERESVAARLYRIRSIDELTVGTASKLIDELSQLETSRTLYGDDDDGRGRR